MKNDSKIAAKKAVPGGVKKDASFTKRSGAKTQKMDAGRKGPRQEFGPRTSANSHSTGEYTNGGVSDDNAGTRSRAELPPETMAMKAPDAPLPSDVQGMASDVLPVPTCDTPLFGVTPWDYARDTKLGKAGSR